MARRAVKVKSRLNLNNDSHSENLKNSPGDFFPSKIRDSTLEIPSKTVSMNSAAVASKRQCKPRAGTGKLKIKMGLILCKKKMLKAGILKMGPNHHFMDLKAFISYARGAAKITNKLISDHELNEIYEKDLMSRCKPNSDHVPMRVISEWLNISHNNSDKYSSPRSANQRRLTPPTKRKSFRSGETPANQRVSRRITMKSSQSDNAFEVMDNASTLPLDAGAQQLMSSKSASPRSISESL